MQQNFSMRNSFHGTAMAIQGDDSLLQVADFIPKLLGPFTTYRSISMSGPAFDRDKLEQV